jgi:hypothetical protein
MTARKAPKKGQVWTREGKGGTVKVKVLELSDGFAHVEVIEHDDPDLQGQLQAFRAGDWEGWELEAGKG